MMQTDRSISTCAPIAETHNLEELQSCAVPTSAGLVPISNFVTFEHAPRSGTITRVDQRRVITIEGRMWHRMCLLTIQVVALSAAI